MKRELNIEELVEKYYNYIYKIVKNYAFSMTSEDIEEIIDDVFIILWSNKSKINYDLPIEPYIVGITKNIIRNKFRNKHITDELGHYENIISDFIDIELISEQNEKINIIKKVLEDMKEEDRTIFELYYYSGKSIKEIAKKLNYSNINIKTKLHRIRKKIKNALIKKGYSYE